VTIDRQGFVPELRHVNQAQYRELEQLALTALTQRSGRELMQLEAIQLFSSLLLPQRGLPMLERKQRLLLSPHKILHTLPFHALEWGEDVLIQHFAVTYIPNLGSLLLQYTVNRETSSVLALGIRDYAVPNHQVISLFDAEQEVEDVARIY
jgi:CHAT domain-containing protein